jgi:N-acylglucosamine-6-phosphate 2-epimerase
LERLCREFDKPVVLEGRVWTLDDVRRAFELGAHAVVVGSAITRPQLITRRFADVTPAARAISQT